MKSLWKTKDLSMSLYACMNGKIQYLSIKIFKY